MNHVERDAAYWQCMGEKLAAMAREAGFVIRIEQRPLQPLAMGNHDDAVTVSPCRLQRAVSV